MNEGIRVALISLGCARNLVDSEVLLGHAVEEGLQVVTEPEDADVVVVNTCGFIDSAKQESIDTILGVARLKQDGNLKGVIAVGCLAQRYGEELAKDLPELDAVFGLSDYSAVPGVVRKIVNGSGRRWVATVESAEDVVDPRAKANMDALITAMQAAPGWERYARRGSFILWRWVGP